MVIRGFIAASLDGYGADKSGGIGWLRTFEDVDYGYNRFISEIETVVLGRTTYDQIPSLGIGWPYPGNRGLVVTSRPLAKPYGGVEAWTLGVDKLISHLREFDEGDVWVVGGAKLQWAFIEAGALEHLDLFLIPVLLGDGVPLFPRTMPAPRTLVLRNVAMLAKGMAHLTYSFA
ncbi:MAG: dihydrofolate reductase family protein [Methylocella sp.]